VDWKRLVHFALLGSSDLEQYAILLVRVSLGLFLVISGATNCLSPAARKLCTKRSLRPEAYAPVPCGSSNLKATGSLFGTAHVRLGDYTSK
jgi:hypothetical protein